MPIFTYTAKNISGKTITGSVDARSKDVAVDLLKDQNLVVISIQEKKEGLLDQINIFKGVPQGEVVTFTRQLSTMISAGLPISRALEVLSNQSQNEKFRKILGISEGETEGRSIEEVRSELLSLIAQAKVYDQAGYVIGKPLANQRVFLLVAVRDFVIPENFIGSQARCITAPTSSAIFTIKKNGAKIGEMVFNAGTNVGVFSSSLSGDISFTAGDYLEIIAPSEQDTTLSDICWNLKIMFT